MQYFKHAELAEKYNVSLRTVHNWVDATKLGRLELMLHDKDGRAYVANTPRNITTINTMIESRKKYRNTKAVKIITPKPEFYTLYSDHQIYDITTNLEIHHEIPRQYNYFNGGANHWDKYAERLVVDDTPNIINSTIRLLKNNQSYLDDLLADYKKINVIDIGVGTAHPVKDLLTHLLTNEKLGRYIALDISPAMLDIAQHNIDQWFGNKISYEGHTYDINRDHFSDFLIDDYVKEDAKDTLNLVLLFGGTLSNMRDSDGGYKTIHDSMGINDLLVHATKLDTQSTRHYFDFDLQPGQTKLAAIHGLVVDLLNIDTSFYTVELGYNPDLKQRFEQIRLNVSLVIKFTFKNGERLIELNKNDTILTWRGLQQTAADVMSQLTKNDFYPLHISQTDDQEYILTVSRVKRD